MFQVSANCVAEPLFVPALNTGTKYMLVLASLFGCLKCSLTSFWGEPQTPLKGLIRPQVLPPGSGWLAPPAAEPVSNRPRQKLCLRCRSLADTKTGLMRRPVS
jgi:hypothetical protein